MALGSVVCLLRCLSLNLIGTTRTSTLSLLHSTDIYTLQSESILLLCIGILGISTASYRESSLQPLTEITQNKQAVAVPFIVVNTQGDNHVRLSG